MELPERHARFIKKDDHVMVGARGLDPVEKAIGRGKISQVYPELKNGRVIADVEIDNLGIISLVSAPLCASLRIKDKRLSFRWLQFQALRS